MRKPLFLLVAAIAATAPANAGAPEPGVAARETRTLAFVEGFAPDGSPAELWTKMVRRLRGDDAAPPPVALPTAEETAWARSIAARLPAWEAEIPALARNFGPMAFPPAARIVAGKAGGEDAFTHDEGTIGFDVGRLLANYGQAELPENRDRLDRFFRHEYVHLLQKQWLARHPYQPRTAVERAWLGIWTEGLGNHYSLSDRWFGPGGGLSDHAHKTLDRLSPRLVERLTALACATPAEADRLLSDLSFGPFDQKWGALPAALWLASEARAKPGALRGFIEGGPAGVEEFVLRNLPEPSRSALTADLETPGSCGSPSGQEPQAGASPRG